MPRDHGRILSSIWRDPDFRRLQPEPQRLYLLLLSQPNVNNAGVLPLQVGKWAKGCESTTEEEILRSLQALSRADFAYFDDDSEETFIRSYIRNDGILKQPNILKNALRCSEAVESAYLRAAIAIELRRLGRVDADSTADSMDPNGTAEDDFSKAHGSHCESFPNPSETLSDIETLSEPLSNPAGKGKGKGKGESLVPEYSLSKDEKKQTAPALPIAVEERTSKPVSIEHSTASAAYERIGKAGNFMALRGIVKWAIHERGEDPATVEAAIVAIYEMGKPVTKQVMGQYLDGFIGRQQSGPGGMSKADAKVQNWLDIGARLTNQQDQPKGIA